MKLFQCLTIYFMIDLYQSMYSLCMDVSNCIYNEDTCMCVNVLFQHFVVKGSQQQGIPRSLHV